MMAESSVSPVTSGEGGQPWATLPSYYYYDPARYEQELEQIWYQNWLYLCRADTLNRQRAFRTFEIGSQNIIVLRDDEGELQAFHNTCRHRGSILCVEREGQLTSKRIVCPYHQWSYSLQGKLAGVPFIGSPEKVSPDDLSLYAVAVREWGGSIFVNLAGDEARPFEKAWEPNINELANWPLADLVTGHTFQTIINCNWKIFWENFQECYHCPGVHPELCDLVPLYQRAMTGTEEVKRLQAQNGRQGPIIEAGVRQGAETWSMDGKIHGARFAGLTEEEVTVGYKYLMALPSVFIVGHPDYVRLVSLYPLGPERLQLTAEWLFLAETLSNPAFDLKNVTDFATLVMQQDGEVCELNQHGLRSIRHKQGVLVPHGIRCPSIFTMGTS